MPFDDPAFIQRRRELAASGLPLSDAMCFGLGAGLTFRLERQAVSPTRLFRGAPERLALPDTDISIAAVRERMPERVRACGQSVLEAAALAAFPEDLRGWPQLPDFRACAAEGARAVHQLPPDRGFYRALFGAFLDEVRGLRPELPLGRLSHDYRELAWSWGELATAMQLAVKDGAWDGVPEHAQRLLERERELAERLLKAA